VSVFSRLVVGTAESKPVQKLITGTKAGRALARRFVAGDTLEDAISAAHQLNRAGMSVSLDLLGEEVTKRDEVELALDGYVTCLRRISAEKLEANISIKLTQLGLSLDEALAEKALDDLALTAAGLGLTVTIDMEDSSHTQATVDLYARAQQRHDNLGLALQAYLFRTPDDLNRLAPLGGHLRLCKGAYVEPETVAFGSKDDVDAAYARLLEMLMADARALPAIATHDPRLIDLTRDLARSRTAPFEFQMLYGIRPQAQKELAAAGYPVRIYVPYGSRWYPYLVRRLAERPANLVFFLRAVFGR
jgi:proline dehydrogenase